MSAILSSYIKDKGFRLSKIFPYRVTENRVGNRVNNCPMSLVQLRRRLSPGWALHHFVIGTHLVDIPLHPINICPVHSFAVTDPHIGRYVREGQDRMLPKCIVDNPIVEAQHCIDRPNSHHIAWAWRHLLMKNHGLSPRLLRLLHCAN